MINDLKVKFEYNHKFIINNHNSLKLIWNLEKGFGTPRDSFSAALLMVSSPSSVQEVTLDMLTSNGLKVY